MTDGKWLYKHNLVLTTPRLILRDESPDDEEYLAAILRIRSEKRALEYLPFKPMESIEEARKITTIRVTRPYSFNFLVELRHPEDTAQIGTAENIIGMCGGVRTPEFGYWIDLNHWGKGYAVEAMRATIDAYWDLWPNGMPSLPEENRNKIVFHILPTHLASIAVAKKLGASKVGEKLEENSDGTKTNVIIDIYELKRPSPEERALAPRGYEKMEAIGANLTEGPPKVEEGSAQPNSR